MKRNQIITIAAIVLLGIIIGASVFFIITNKKSSDDETVQVKKKSSINFVEIKPEEIELELTPLQNNQVIRMVIGKPDGINSLEYELSYDAVENGETVSRGAIGTVDFKKGDKPTRDIDLGTCSSGVCKYDKGVEQVHFVIRINYGGKDPGIVETDLVFE